MNIYEIKGLEMDRFESLLEEGVTDMPEGSSAEQQIDILTQRLSIAKKMLGITNRLSDPAERKKHRSRVMGFLNQLRAMLKGVMAKLETEQQSDI